VHGCPARRPVVGVPEPDSCVVRPAAGVAAVVRAALSLAVAADAVVVHAGPWLAPAYAVAALADPGLVAAHVVAAWLVPAVSAAWRSFLAADVVVAGPAVAWLVDSVVDVVAATASLAVVASELDAPAVFPVLPIAPAVAAFPAGLDLPRPPQGFRAVERAPLN
jgi:hypothetical protein